MWLVTKRCGKNFLLGDLVTTTIRSNLRVPGLLTDNIGPGMRFEIMHPSCRARRADHFSVELSLIIGCLSTRLPLFSFNIGGDRDQNLIIFHHTFLFDIFKLRTSQSCRGFQGGHFCVFIAGNIDNIYEFTHWSRRMLDNRFLFISHIMTLILYTTWYI